MMLNLRVFQVRVEIEHKRWVCRLCGRKQHFEQAPRGICRCGGIVNLEAKGTA